MTLASTASLHTAAIGGTIPDEAVIGLMPAAASGLEADPVSDRAADPDAALAGFLGLFELFAGTENGTSAVPDNCAPSGSRPRARVPGKDPWDADSVALAAWAGLVQIQVIPVAAETPSLSTPASATATGLPALGVTSPGGDGQFVDTTAKDAETAGTVAAPVAEIAGDTGPAADSLTPGMLAEAERTEEDAKPNVQSTPTPDTDAFTPYAGPLEKDSNSRGIPEVPTDETDPPAGNAAPQTGPVEAAAESVFSRHEPQGKAAERTAAAAKGQSTAPGGGDEVDCEPPAFENGNAGTGRAAASGELAFKMHMRPKSPEDAASQPLNGNDAPPAVRTVPGAKPSGQTRTGGPPSAPEVGADSTPPRWKASDASAGHAEPSPTQPQRTSSGDSGTPHRDPSERQRQSTTERSATNPESAGNWGPAAEVRTAENGSDKAEKTAAPASGSARPAADAGHPAENRADRQRPAAPARDIRLVLNGGERPVQVRVVERAGELHVDVRTPDARLAGNLREQLPELTARLEDNGFRAQAWHPQSDSADRLRTLEIRSPAAENGRESNPKGGGRDAQDAPPKPRIPEEERRSKQDREAFAGLMGSIA